MRGGNGGCQPRGLDRFPPPEPGYYPCLTMRHHLFWWSPRPLTSCQRPQRMRRVDAAGAVGARGGARGAPRRGCRRADPVIAHIEPESLAAHSGSPKCGRSARTASTSSRPPATTSGSSASRSARRCHRDVRSSNGSSSPPTCRHNRRSRSCAVVPRRESSSFSGSRTISSTCPTRPPRARSQVLAETIELVLIGHYDAHRDDIEAKRRAG